MNFLHSFIPRPVIFTIGSIDVYWYGIIIAIGLLIGLFVMIKLAIKKQVSVSHIYNLFFYCVIFCLIGARIGHVIGEWNYYKDHLGDIYKIWDGGLAAFGAIFAGILTAYIYCKVKKISIWNITDVSLPGIILSQAIGRWGNYSNQEIFGKPTDSAWGIPIELSRRPLGYENFNFFHPLFLYESLLDLIVFIILIFYLNSKKARKGITTLLYFLLYSIIRLFLEFLKINAVSLGFLTVVQWISLLVILAVIILFFVIRRFSDSSRGLTN